MPAVSRQVLFIFGDGNYFNTMVVVGCQGPHINRIRAVEIEEGGLNRLLQSVTKEEGTENICTYCTKCHCKNAGSELHAVTHSESVCD